MQLYGSDIGVMKFGVNEKSNDQSQEIDDHRDLQESVIIKNLISNIICNFGN